MVNHDFDSSILAQVAHRPWAMPQSPWVMTQTWLDLLFAHWPVEPSQLRSKVPEPFALDVFDGVAWIAVVPFHMTNVSPRGVPSMPWLSEFPELNVRTYVRVHDRPGVYFLSLDAGSSLAVQTARALLNLPYHTASMKVTAHDATIAYESHRKNSKQRADFEATYRPVGPPSTAVPGSLEHFLTERYCLYHLDRRGAPYRLEIHHPPWHLQPAQAEVVRNTMAAASGITLSERAPLLHYVKRQDMVAWMPMDVLA